jgi:AraC family transcriptional activator FtrA
MRAKEAILATGSHSVAIAAFDGLSLFEFAVACAVFRPQSWLAPDAAWYRMQVCSAGATAVRLGNGLRMDVPDDLSVLATCDTVVVPPCDDPAGVPAEVVEAIKTAHANGARLVSLCTGVFVLAAAGLLDGRRVTTHWDECPRLIRDYAGRLAVDPDVLYVDDGDILTSAGSAASIDLCLHIVRNDYGADVATRLARDLVVPPYRDGGQAQYIATPLPDPSTSDLFVDTVAWVQEHLADPITINDLARRSAMSRRTFARRFLETTGTTPYRWLLRQRLQLAQRLLETTDLPVEAIADRSGFVNAGNLRKHFSRLVRTSPHGYRRTFQNAGADV